MSLKTHFQLISRACVLAATTLAVAMLAMFALNLAAARAETRDSYELSVGDGLTFDFLDDAELPIAVTIGEDGQVQLPLIGGVKVAGLSVINAIEFVRSEYRRREILVDPRIALSVSSFRPMFVLGEVRSPGLFPFSIGITVEQAVGLAGGTQTAASNPADRIVAQARLRGEIEGTAIQIVQEGVFAARLVAQLAGRDVIDQKDAPKSAQKYLEQVPSEGVVEIETRILQTDLANFKNQVAILTDGIAEAEKGMKLLDELEVKQQEILETTKKDMERIASLRERGLNTASEVSRGERAETNEESRLLEIYAEMSQGRRELGSLRLNLAQLQANRQKELLQQLQERQIAIEKLAVERKNMEQQLLLMSSTALDDDRAAKSVSFAYEIRRTSGGTVNTFTGTPTTELKPGDVIVVKIVGL